MSLKGTLLSYQSNYTPFLPLLGSILVLINSEILSESSFIFLSPATFPSSLIPKNNEPPTPLAKADTVFSQLLGF